LHAVNGRNSDQATVRAFGKLTFKLGPAKPTSDASGEMMSAEMRGTIGSNRTLLSVMGALEAATGLVLLAVPSVLVELLFGAAPGTPAGVTVSRVAGAALLALGVACWLARDDVSGRAAKGLVSGMLFYNVAVVAILVLAWTRSGLSGVAFWPVVMVHSGLAAWCGAGLSARTLKEKRP
jgi:hypothetical protein